MQFLQKSPHELKSEGSHCWFHTSIRRFANTRASFFVEFSTTLRRQNTD
jgi:hypothetical protein